ncbi:MAG: hypothetical protein EBX41_02560 [Chitinophagia bacterium]|nr:hypothetical protein [Chitinophagia bacterium]
MPKLDPRPYQKQAQHNERFHDNICSSFPDDFFDWKITILFYIAIHHVKALANQLGITIGESHRAINGNIKPPDDSPRKPTITSIVLLKYLGIMGLWIEVMFLLPKTHFRKL